MPLQRRLCCRSQPLPEALAAFGRFLRLSKTQKFGWLRSRLPAKSARLLSGVLDIRAFLDTDCLARRIKTFRRRLLIQTTPATFILPPRAVMIARTRFSVRSAPTLA